MGFLCAVSLCDILRFHFARLLTYVCVHLCFCRRVHSLYGAQELLPIVVKQSNGEECGPVRANEEKFGGDEFIKQLTIVALKRVG